MEVDDPKQCVNKFCLTNNEQRSFRGISATLYAVYSSLSSELVSTPEYICCLFFIATFLCFPDTPFVPKYKTILHFNLNCKKVLYFDTEVVLHYVCQNRNFLRRGSSESASADVHS